MSKRYQVLARKYRPQAFRDVVGQEAAVITLKNAIRFDRIAHAYLFCGSRGVGKTTLARLFAKALNCQALTPEFEPCNNCPSCKEIASGQSLDVIEIDGASNRGIDDIRQINETVGFVPSHGRYKIYIIDEVHMLTKEAFNALLKTLEEPPEQVKFFFATTEPHKVLPTIISRCQRFDLARILPPFTVSKLTEIAQDLSRTVETEALELIAAFSEGSLRDAESLFDQILCFSDETITAAIVRQTLGLAPKELFSALDQAFGACQLSYAFELVEKLFQTGKDLGHFFEQLIEHYRNIVLAKCKNAPDSKIYTQSQALFILDLLIQAESNFQKSIYQRIALESTLMQIIRSKNRLPIEVLVRHLTDNESKIKVPPLTREEPTKIETPTPEPKAEVVAKQMFIEAPIAQALAEQPLPKVEPAVEQAFIETPTAQALAEQPLPKVEPVVEQAFIETPTAQALAELPLPKVEPVVEQAFIETPIAQALAELPLPKVEPVVEQAFIETPIAQALAEQPLPKVEPVQEPITIEPPIVPVEVEVIIPLPPSAPETEPEPAAPLMLKAVPFNPYVAAKEPPKVVVAQKPQSHYDTIIRFAAVEFEGTVKN